ncbi:MAG: class IV adenylate cyclase [Pyrinomonadaceae bacterium]|nr:class IV adenylate cyclase [Pyrinomonadaceae bacterium]
MGVEIEKKYRLTMLERERVLKHLGEIKAEFCGEEFEENTLYSGGIINLKNCVLRLRRAGDNAILTYKERFESASAIKRQREDETKVESGEAMAAILDALGYKPALVYEKRRRTWRVGETEVVVDELPFGFFMEIEGAEQAIIEAEKLLELEDVEAEMATYPQLTAQHGKQNGAVIEARF